MLTFALYDDSQGNLDHVEVQEGDRDLGIIYYDSKLMQCVRHVGSIRLFLSAC